MNGRVAEDEAVFPKPVEVRHVIIYRLEQWIMMLGMGPNTSLPDSVPVVRRARISQLSGKDEPWLR